MTVSYELHACERSLSRYVRYEATAESHDRSANARERPHIERVHIVRDQYDTVTNASRDRQFMKRCSVATRRKSAAAVRVVASDLPVLMRFSKGYGWSEGTREVACPPRRRKNCR